MKKAVLAVSCIIAMLLFASCKHTIIDGTGPQETDKRDVKAFTELEVEAHVNTVIIVDTNIKEAKVEFSGYKSLLPYVKTQLEGKSLHIYCDEHIEFSTDKIVIATITVPSLSALTISGKGDAHITGDVHVPDFTTRVSGEGAVEIDSLYTDNFNCSVAGVGNIKIGGGHAKKANCTLSGAGDMQAYAITIDTCTASISGAGEMELTVTSELTATVSGLGGITYQGHPHVTSQINGVGSVSPAE